MIGKRLFILSFVVFFGLINLNVTANASYLASLRTISAFLIGKAN